jgi:hypothetical protein
VVTLNYSSKYIGRAQLRVFKTKWFARFARRVRIGDDSICEVIERANSGLIDADLGGNIIKQRIARSGQGRSGGYRFLIGYRRGDRAIFIYGFAKNELENIDNEQLATLREIATEWLDMNSEQLSQALIDGRAEEVYCGPKK